MNQVRACVPGNEGQVSPAASHAPVAKPVLPTSCVLLSFSSAA